MKSPAQEIDQALTNLKKTNNNAFMATLDKEEEIKYIKHNKDRFVAVLEVLDTLLGQNNKKLSLLDIGSSPLTFILKKRYPHINITTLDLSPNLSKRCKEVDINFIQADLNYPNRLPTVKKYDVIVFLEVLEHLRCDHKKIIKWISTILKENGTCVLQTPNKYSLKQLILAFIGGLKTWDKLSKRPTTPDEFAHFKEYSLPELKSLIAAVPTLKINKANHPLYYDTLESSIVYRKFTTLAKPLLYVHYLITFSVPTLRRGMLVIFSKEKS